MKHSEEIVKKQLGEAADFGQSQLFDEPLETVVREALNYDSETYAKAIGSKE